MGRLISTATGASFFGGSTTGVHFMTQAEQQQHTTFPSAVFGLHLHAPLLKSEQSIDDYRLPAMVQRFPPRGELLIDSTMERWLQAYPLWHRGQTVQRYRTLCADPHSATAADVYQMLVLLALGMLESQSRTTEESHFGRALNHKSFYDLSATLLDEVLECPCLASLQGLATTGIYLQVTGRHSKALQLGGATIRLAQSLGLHRHLQRFKFNPMETELRKRTWWCIYSQDVYGHENSYWSVRAYVSQLR
jgi:hypothetical protein